MKGKPFGAFACHADVPHGAKPDDCVINVDHYSSCIYGTTDTGRPRRSPNGCPYWRPIPERPS